MKPTLDSFTKQLIERLKRQQREIQVTISVLESGGHLSTQQISEETDEIWPPAGAKKKRVISPAARKKMADAAKKRWAERKAGKK